jgi:hypothetical protein
MTDEKKPKVFAEDRMAHAIDRCFSDAVIKSGKLRIHQMLVKNYYYIREG